MLNFEYTLSKVRTLVKKDSITGTNYRSVVHPDEPGKLVTNEEMADFFFNGHRFGRRFARMIMRFDTLELQETLFRFYMAIPFTDYEFNYVNAVHPSERFPSMTNQQAKQKLETKASTSSATNNKLTTALVEDIDFFQESDEIPDSFFEETLQKILKKAKKMWIETLDEDQKMETGGSSPEVSSVADDGDLLIASLSHMAFFLKKQWLDPAEPENRSQLLFNIRVIAPLTDFINELIGVEFIVAPHNPYGTGYDAMLANQTDSVQHAFSDICVFRQHPECYSVLVVEVKKFPLMSFLDQNYPKKGSEALARFHLQLLTQMLTNRINRGVLTDAENTILIQVNHKKLKELRDASTSDEKCVPLHYKLLNTHSAGITLRGGILAFLYESMTLSKEGLADIAEEMDDLFKFLKLTDESFLGKLDSLSEREIEPIKALLEESLPGERIECFYQEISSFEQSDIQTGFKFNTQVFKVIGKDLISLADKILHSQLSASIKSEGVMVAKVFDPLKSKSRSLGKPYNRNEVRVHCIKSFMQEREIYNRLQGTDFKSCYIPDQPVTFFKFLIGDYYHALGPCIFLRYIDHQLKEFPFGDSEYYDLAQEQLKILHNAGISHNDLSRRNVLCTHDGTPHVYLIDFGYSSMQKVVETVTKKSLIKLQEADKEDLYFAFYGSSEISTDENKSLGQS